MRSIIYHFFHYNLLSRFKQSKILVLILYLISYYLQRIYSAMVIIIPAAPIATYAWKNQNVRRLVSFLPLVM